MSTRVRVAFCGATGYVGRALVPAILDHPDFELVGALGRRGAGTDVGALLGRAAAGVTVTDDIAAGLSGDPDVLIDYSAPAIAEAAARAAVERGISVVLATTGVDEDTIEQLGATAAANGAAVFPAPNLTVTGHLMMQCAALVGKRIGDVEIVEGHPSSKLDSPSGTSLETADVINGAGHPGTTPDATRLGAPESRGTQVGRVRIHSMRLPGMVDHQEVIFSRPGELITIRTESFTADAFVEPTLNAARLLLAERGLVRTLPGIFDAS